MFKIDKIILKTVRPFYIEDVILKETEIDPTQEDMVMAYLVNKVGSIKIILKNQYYGCEDLHSFIFFYDTQIKWIFHFYDGQGGTVDWKGKEGTHR